MGSDVQLLLPMSSDAQLPLPMGSDVQLPLPMGSDAHLPYVGQGDQVFVLCLELVSPRLWLAELIIHKNSEEEKIVRQSDKNSVMPSLR